MSDADVRTELAACTDFGVAADGAISANHNIALDDAKMPDFSRFVDVSGGVNVAYTLLWAATSGAVELIRGIVFGAHTFKRETAHTASLGEKRFRVGFFMVREADATQEESCEIKAKKTAGHFLRAALLPAAIPVPLASRAGIGLNRGNPALGGLACD